MEKEAISTPDTVAIETLVTKNTNINPIDIPVYPIFEKENLVKDLNKDFFIAMKFADFLEFEKGFNLLHIFDNEYMLVEQNTKAFFNYVTSRYEVFTLNDIKDDLKNIGITDEAAVFCNRYNVWISSKDVFYTNSYSKLTKEAVIYRPYLINVSGFRHHKKHKVKRNSLIHNLGNVVEFCNNYSFEIKSIEVSPEFIIEMIDTFGIRNTKDILGLPKEKDWKDMDEKSKINLIENMDIKNIGDVINFVNRVYKNMTETKNKFQTKSFITVSNQITDLIQTALNSRFF